MKPLCLIKTSRRKLHPRVAEWASIHHDAHNTGNYEVGLPAQKGPDLSVTPGELKGCKGCARGTKAEDSGAALLLLLPLGLGLRRRRRG
mgnify:CR=1 FL=1